MIGDEDRELFERSLRHATSTSSGAELDAALAALGWRDALVDDARVAVSLLFELQGRSGAVSGALDAVLASSLGLEPGVAVVLPGGLGTAYLARSASAYVDGAVVPTSSLELVPVQGLDPALGLVRVPGGSGELDEAAVAAGRRALAHELVGASRAMLELARVHALERIQFGRPIAQFQAVRHKLAETLVAIEGAADATGAAWEEGTALAAAVAKAVAGRSARTAAKHCQQVLAGIGFTQEHPFHHHLRRALVLDRLLGDAKGLTREIGQVLLDERAVPPILAL